MLFRDLPLTTNNWHDSASKKIPRHPDRMEKLLGEVGNPSPLDDFPVEKYEVQHNGHSF